MTIENPSRYIKKQEGRDLSLVRSEEDPAPLQNANELLSVPNTYGEKKNYFASPSAAGAAAAGAAAFLAFFIFL